MALINNDNTLYLAPNEYKLRKISYTRAIQQYDSDFWYCEFFNDQSLHWLYDNVVLSPDAIERFHNRTCLMVLNNAHEAFHQVVEVIYKTCIIDLKIPPEQIILISESAIIDKEVEKVSQQYNLGKIRTKWMRMFEFAVSRLVDPFKSLNTLEYKYYHKKYINLNRRWRLHRPALVALLKIYNLLDKGFVSLAKADDNRDWNLFLDEIQWTFKENPDFLNIFLQNQDMIRDIPELKLDKEDMTINYAGPPYLLAETTDTFYLNSYFSIVTETNFFKVYGEGVFVSEKIFRPVLKKHPFILLARPRTLEVMRHIGYKTFGNIINEDYDKEEDDYKRMLMIIDEINRLSTLSDYELSKFLDEARKITEYNYNVLSKKTNFITDL